MRERFLKRSRMSHPSSAAKWVQEKMLAYQACAWRDFEASKDFFFSVDAVQASGKDGWLFAVGCPVKQLHAWAPPQVAWGAKRQSPRRVNWGFQNPCLTYTIGSHVANKKLRLGGFWVSLNTPGFSKNKVTLSKCVSCPGQACYPISPVDAWHPNVP